MPHRPPQAGSKPRLDAGQAVRAAEQTGSDRARAAESGWRAHLPERGMGRPIFMAGLATLVLSICGLITVGIRRRLW